MKPIFNEEQKFTQWWLWVILIGIGIMPIIAIFSQLFSQNEFVIDSISNVYFTLFSLLSYGLIALFLMFKLKTEIDSREIKMIFFPFLKKQIRWKEIKTAEVIDYGFVGGWGIRLGTQYGTVYNISGSKGLAIELKNGKKLVIGTQKETEMAKVVEEIIKTNC